MGEELSINIKIETYLEIATEDMTVDSLTELVLDFATLVVERGFGNVSDTFTDDTPIKSIIVIKTQVIENTQEFFAELSKNAIAITIPTGDKEFLEKSKIAGLDVLGE